MALNYSNILGTTSSTTPASAALSNKIAPPSLFTMGALAPKPFTPLVPQIGKKQQVVSQTVNPDGTVVHKFTTDNTGGGAPASPSPAKIDPGTGQPVVSGSFAPGTPQNQGAVPPTASPSATPTPPAAPPSSPFQTATQGLISIGQNGSQGYNQAVQHLQDVQNSQAKENARIETLPVGVGDQTGREAVANRLYQAQIGNAQQAVGQQQTQQGQQISALGNAGSLSTATSPFGQYSYGQQGAVGANSGAAGGLTYNPSTDAANFAKKVISGQLSYNDAVSALGYAGGIGTGLLQSAITSNGGNLPQIEAQTSARQQGVTGNAIDTQAINGAQNNIDSITQLINGSNLNNSGINLQNATIQLLQKNLSNSDYATLTNALQSIDNALSKVTGAPVDIAQLSTSQGSSLIDTINNQVQLAKGIAAGKLSGSNTQTNGTNSGSIYDF